jgi:Domain of unknown function (DUF397)
MRGVVSSAVRVDGDRCPGSEADYANWRISSFSEETQCVEVSISDDAVLVRNSRDRSRPFLTFRPTEWAAFTAGIRGGQFDGPGGVQE